MNCEVILSYCDKCQAKTYHDIEENIGICWDCLHEKSLEDIESENWYDFIEKEIG